MKTTAVATVALAALSQVAQAHYIFQQLTANGAKGALCTLQSYTKCDRANSNDINTQSRTSALYPTTLPSLFSPTMLCDATSTVRAEDRLAPSPSLPAQPCPSQLTRLSTTRDPLPST